MKRKCRLLTLLQETLLSQTDIWVHQVTRRDRCMISILTQQQLTQECKSEYETGVNAGNKLPAYPCRLTHTS